MKLLEIAIVLYGDIFETFKETRDGTLLIERDGKKRMVNITTLRREAVRQEPRLNARMGHDLDSIWRAVCFREKIVVTQVYNDTLMNVIKATPPGSTIRV